MNVDRLDRIQGTADTSCCMIVDEVAQSAGFAMY
jgi:hypothetical protein